MADPRPTADDTRALGLLVDSLPSLIAYITAEERYAVANRAYRDWFGADPRTLIGRTLLEVLGEPAYNAVQPYVRRALAGERVTFDTSIPYRNGTRHVEASYVPDQDDEGHVTGYIALINDISETKRLEHQLREQAATTATLNRVGRMLTGELDVHRLVQAVTDAATELSAAEFGAFFYNVLDDAGESFMLYTLSGVPREAFARFPMPRNTAIFDHTFRGLGIVRIDDVLADPRYGRNPPHYGMPKGHLPVRSYLAVPVVSRTGEVLGGLFFGHSRAGMFTERVEGLIDGLAAQAAVAIDNTRLFSALQRETRQAEAAARRSDFLSQASRMLSASLEPTVALENVADLVVRTLGDVCAIDVLVEGVLQPVVSRCADPGHRAILDEVRAHSGPDQTSRLYRALRVGPELVNVGPELVNNDVAGAPDLLDREEAPPTRLGDPGLTAWMIVPLLHGGTPLGTLIIGSTSARRYEAEDLRTAEELAYRTALALSNARLYTRAQEASRLKDEFLAIVSHELRTPLNAMRGWTALLRTMQLDDVQKRHALDVIDRNISAQTQLVEDLLDLSRIASGKMRLSAQTVDPAAVVRTAIDSLRPTAEARAIRLRHLIDPAAGPIWGDPDRLQQIVWNLLSNALKFTPRGGRVHLVLRQVDSDVELTVADTGQGITPDFLPHVFDSFRQADSTTTRPVGGLGLGLAIVRHLVELHGGTVKAESAGEGEGATFRVRIPVAAVAPRPGDDRRTRTSPDLPTLRLDGIRVLCVDDDEETCEVLSLLLQGAGAEVRTACRVAEAIPILETWSPDVLISDIEMPEEDGYSLVQRLRTMDAGSGRRTLAIAVTAYARTEDRVRTLSAGYHSHVPKPVNPAELLALLHSLLGRGPAPSVNS